MYSISTFSDRHLFADHLKVLKSNVAIANMCEQEQPLIYA